MTGLKISTAKTMMMRWNSPTSGEIQVDREEVEEVTKFVYRRNSDPERRFRRRHQNRFGKARTEFNKLRNIWKSRQMKLNTKLKIFKSNIVAVLLYGCEKRRMTKNDATKLDVFLHKNLRRIMKIYWPLKVSNEERIQRIQLSITGLTSTLSARRSIGGAEGSLATPS